MEEYWPISEARCAEILKIKPRTLRRRLKDIRNALPDEVPYTKTGRSRVFFEDDFEKLRECLKSLSRLKRTVGASQTVFGAEVTPSEVQLPGEAYTEAPPSQHIKET